MKAGNFNWASRSLLSGLYSWWSNLPDQFLCCEAGPLYIGSNAARSESSTLGALRREPSILSVTCARLETDLEKCLKRVCMPIFEEQLDGWYRVEELWPLDRSITVFREWFEYRFHSMPIDLANEPLVWEEL